MCEEKALHVAGTEEAQVMQCINCGYTTSTKFRGTKETNENSPEIGEDMKQYDVKKNLIWIPSYNMGKLGMLYPVNIKKEMKWAFAPMIEIPEDDSKNFL